MRSLASVNDSRLEKMNIAAGLHSADRELRGSVSSASLGMLCIFVALRLKGPTEWSGLGLGLLLILEGAYLDWKLKPRVVEITIVTLVAIAFWYGIVIRIWASDSLEILLICAFGLTAGLAAWRLWKSSASYRRFRQESDPAAVTELSSILRGVTTPDPSSDVIEYNIVSFFKGNQIWRVVPFDGLLLFVKNERVFRKVAFATECFIVDKKDVRLKIGESSSDQNAKVRLLIGTDRTHDTAMPLRMILKIDGLLS
jgi:hypothetical protein